MPVQVFPSSHEANPIKGSFAEDPMDMLMSAWPSSKFCELIQSSFTSDNMPSTMLTSSNGFVHSIVGAYNKHRHLKVRPDDIWFAVLTQIGLYINKNAEELRDKFVAHEGKKELVLSYPGSRHSFDFGVFAQDMTRLMEKNVVDPELRGWMMPDFTTTTRQDNVIASILMMGSMQKYFSYKCMLMCGIPSVTLLGEKEDYVKILGRLDKLSTFGKESTQFGELLKPILSWMVRTFETPDAQGVLSFWQRMVSEDHRMSGTSYYSGWMTAFCFWDEEGHSLYGKPGGINLDGVQYHRIATDKVPPGWAKVPVKLDDNGVVLETEMVAGSVGITCSSSQSQTGSEAVLDTVQPESGWWMYAMSEGEHRALAEFRKKAQAAGVKKEYIDSLVRGAERSGKIPSDGTIEMYKRYD